MAMGLRAVQDMVLQTAAQIQQERVKRIQKAQRSYDGLWRRPLAATRLDPSGGDNVTVNHARRTVDISAYYLFGREVGFEVLRAQGDADDSAAGDESRDDPADTWLEACWDANDKMPTLLEFATSAGVAGDGYIRLLPPDPLNPAPDGAAYPRILALDPMCVDAVWDPQDYSKVIQWQIQTTGIDPLTSRPMLYRTLIERTERGDAWEISEQVSAGNGTAWQTVEGPVRWKYPWCPIFHTKNRPCPHTFYGTSDLEDDVLRINDSINFILSNINRILRAHGHPLNYVAGQSPETVERAIGQMLYLPNPDAKVGSVEMISDLTSSFSQLKELLTAYHELTSVPEIASGKLENVGQLSGLALQILYGPLVALTNTKRMFYGTMLRRVCRALLEMGGKQAGVTDIAIQWPTVIPTDRKAEADTAAALHDVGVSRDTVLTELGYDAADEAKKREAEGADVAQIALAAFDRGDGRQQDGSRGGAFGGGNDPSGGAEG